MVNLASVAIQVLPLTENEQELYRIVDEVIAYIKSFDLPTVVGPFETTVEGDYDTLLEIVKNVSPLALQAGAQNLLVNVKIAAANERSVQTIAQKTDRHQR
ncbi:MAG: thiamine-binding protein [Bacillota bacterium]|jgi:uncharacterized protein YqgV (UPF0045/DUF77 family)